MAQKPSGNIYYESLIVVLTLILIWTILYPSKVWNREDELRDICRTRMETVHQMELQYLNKVYTYSDSVEKVINHLTSDPTTLAILDTLLLWDKLVTKKELKQLVNNKKFPEELRDHILRRLRDGEPLGKLVIWDSLEYRFVHQLKTSVETHDSLEIASVDSGIIWPVLLGEYNFWNIIEDSQMPRWVQNRTKSDIRKGKPIIETTGWKYLSPVFYDSLQSLIEWAERKDVWKENEKDYWEVVRKNNWESEMDTLSVEVRDSLWQEYKRRFWDREKELVWKKERKKLWNNEKVSWKKNNTAMWKRILSQSWASERKKEWEVESISSMPDSLKETFSTQKDSLWRSIVDSIYADVYENWERKNQKRVKELIHNLWESDRRFTWEEEAYERWLIKKQGNKDVIWQNLKEEIWSSRMNQLWKKEQIKLNRKVNALMRLDRAVIWVKVLGMDRIENLVNQLDLPDNQGLWTKIEETNKKSSSSLYNLGIVGLFRDTLLNFSINCPVANVPNLVSVSDTFSTKYMSIRCPIEDKTRKKVALIVDPIVKDTTSVALKLPLSRKLFGGGSIKNHGNIDKEGKKSWERRGR